jgi:hypothetical protein
MLPDTGIDDVKKQRNAEYAKHINDPVLLSLKMEGIRLFFVTYRSLRHDNHSSREALPSVVSKHRTRPWPGIGSRRHTGGGESVCVCVCVCVCVKMPSVRLYSMRLQQLQKIIRPSIKNIVRICKQIITTTFCKASNRLVVVKFVNTSTKILVIVVPTDCFIRTDFISYILSYLYLKYRPI